MKKTKIITFFIALTIMVSACTTAYASSYTTSVYFQGQYTGATRDFNGQNIRYTATTTSDNPNYINKVYTVSLYRKTLIGGTLIGQSQNLMRDGYSKVDWSNVGPDKYYLYFSKARDGIHVSSDDVVIKNY